MPVKLGSKLLTDSAEARIEIIPLIDIMFFLLAAFMLVSLSMVNVKSMKVDLPPAATASKAALRGLVNITVDKAGLAYLDSKLVGANELALALRAVATSNSTARVIIRGDRDARHGEVIRVLDIVRGAGIQQVAIEVLSPEMK